MGEREGGCEIVTSVRLEAGASKYSAATCGMSVRFGAANS